MLMHTDRQTDRHAYYNTPLLCRGTGVTTGAVRGRQKTQDQKMTEILGPELGGLKFRTGNRRTVGVYSI